MMGTTLSRVLWITAGLTIASLGTWNTASAQTPEYRAFWVDAWGDGFLNQSQVDQLLGVVGDPNSKGTIRNANCNMVVVQVRRRGDVCYPSGMGEPYFSGLTPSNFNAMQAMLNAAHDTTGGKQRIDVHAWIVVFANSTSGGTPSPLYYQHNNPADPENYWVTLSDTGAETDDKAFDPGHPNCLQYIYNVCMDLVSNFDIDGIHYDYIRFTANNQGYNPRSIARYNARYGLSGQPAASNEQFKQWRRDQVTALVRKVHANIQSVKPWVDHSGAFVTWNPSPSNSTRSAFQATRPYYDVYSDWDSWIQEGIIDIAIPMTYYNYAQYPTDYTKWMNFEKDRKANRHMVIGPGIYLNSLSNAILELQMTRGQSDAGEYAHGFCGYSYRSPYSGGTWSAFSPSLVTDVTLSPAPLPTMTWKTSPTTGHIMGTVTLADTLAWADGATVNLTGPVNRTMLCDGTGFYAFIDLPLGNYTVTASYTGYPNAVANANVAIGVVTGNMYKRDLVLGNTNPPVISSVQAGSVGNTTATITWTTDVASSSQVEYGLTTSYGSTTTLDSTQVTSHSVNLSGLSQNTTYHYRVKSGNNYGTTTSGDNTFTTTVADIQIDNTDSGWKSTGSSSWTTRTTISDKIGSNYFYGSGVTGTTEASATRKCTWTPTIQVAGPYDVYAYYQKASNYATSVPFKVVYNGGSVVSNQNQYSSTTTGGWYLISSDRQFAVGTAGYVQLSNNAGSTSRCGGDAVKFVFKSAIPPTITQHPSAQGACQNGTAMFTVVANGQGTLSYQWQKNGTNLSNGGHYTGATTSTLTIAGADSSDIANYRCVVSNLGGSVTSNAAALTVVAEVVITQQPTAQSVCPDGTVPLSVTATGDGTLSYQWQKNSTILTNGGHYAGVTTATLTISSADRNDAATYYCVVTGQCNSVTTSGAQVTLKNVTTVTQHPTTVAACAGSTAQFTVIGVGDGSLSYQWQKNSSNLNNGGHYSGATTATLTVTGVDANDVANYRCIITGGCGSATSNHAALTIRNATAVSQHPTAVNACPGATAAFSVTASGDGTLSYQWQKNGTNLSNGGHYTGTTTATLSITGLDSSDVANYRCVVTGGCGAVTSNQAALTLKSATVLSQQPTNQAATSGSTVQFGVIASGDGTVVYQWQKNGTNLSNGGHYSGVTTNTLTIAGIDSNDIANYRCLVTAGCGSVTSEPASLSIYNQTSITQHPVPASVCEGGTAQFNVIAAGDGVLSYQWQKNGTNLSNGGHYSGATTATLTISGTDANDVADYRCVVTGTYGTVTSDQAALSLKAATAVTEHPAPANLCAGATVQFSVTATGNGSLTYQWQKNGSNLNNGGHYSGVTTNTLTVANTDTGDAAAYRCVVTAGCGNQTSNEAALSLKSATTVTQHPAGLSIASGNTAQFTTTASGDGTLSYQWRKNGTDLTDGGRFSGTTSATLTIANTNSGDNGDYQCVVTGGCGNTASNSAALTVYNITTITLQPAAESVCPGGTAQFAVMAGGDGTLSYQWQKNGTNLSNGGHYSDVTAATLTISSVDATDVANYSCIVTGEHGTATSDPATLELKPLTSITQQPSNLTITAGGTAQFQVTASGDGILTYRWQKNGENLTDSERIAGSTTATLTISAIVRDDEGSYRCVVAGGCGVANTNAASLTATVIADFNGDLHVDSTDFDVFSACYNGPTNAATGDCLIADFNNDHYVDSTDFDVFSACYNGPVNPPSCK